MSGYSTLGHSCQSKLVLTVCAAFPTSNKGLQPYLAVLTSVYSAAGHPPKVDASHSIYRHPYSFCHPKWPCGTVATQWVITTPNVNNLYKMACTELFGVITGAFEFVGYSEHRIFGSFDKNNF